MLFCKLALCFGKILEMLHLFCKRKHGNPAAACLKYGDSIDLIVCRVWFRFSLLCYTQPAVAISKPGKTTRRRVCVFGVFQYLIEFLKWSSAGFLTVQLLSSQRSASAGSSGKEKKKIWFILLRHNGKHYQSTTDNKQNHLSDALKESMRKKSRKSQIPTLISF